MSADKPTEPRPETSESADIERREALIKLGKYTAYAVPVVLTSVSSALGAQLPPAPGTPHS